MDTLPTVLATTMNWTSDENASTTISSISNNDDVPYADFNDIRVRAEYFLSQPYYIIAFCLSFSAIFANVTSLAALFQIRKSMTSHYRILVSLIASDLLVDVSAVAHIINSIMHPLLDPGYGDWHTRLASRCSYMTIKALNNTGLNITLLNLMAMAIDRYIAILRPFKLHTLMSRRQTIFMLITLWFIAFTSGFSDFFSPISINYTFTLESNNNNINTNNNLTDSSNIPPAAIRLNLCELVWMSAYQEEYTTFAIVIICFVSMFYMYLHIYCEVKGKSLGDTVNDVKHHRNKRALVTTLLILGTFVFCWLPISIFSVSLIIITKVGISQETLQSIYPILKQVDKYLYDLMLLNTLLDPIIYAIRMNEIRRGYFILLSHCIPSNSRLFLKLRRQSNLTLMESMTCDTPARSGSDTSNRKSDAESARQPLRTSGSSANGFADLNNFTNISSHNGHVMLSSTDKEPKPTSETELLQIR